MTDNATPPARAERLDADAVCIECGSVNPEGTLICKVCGNNLRDQRTRRLASLDAVAEVETKPPGRREWVRGGLVLLGMLLILVTTLNTDRISGWLVGMGTETGEPSAELWDGPVGDALNAMLAELQADPLDYETLLAAIESPLPGSSYAGRYALVMQGAEDHAGPVGEALVESTETGVRYVAVLENGGHVRGYAEWRNQLLASDWRMAAAEQGSAPFAAAGIAMVQPRGIVECLGQSALSGARYAFLAYRVPEL